MQKHIRRGPFAENGKLKYLPMLCPKIMPGIFNVSLTQEEKNSEHLSGNNS